MHLKYIIQLAKKLEIANNVLKDSHKFVFFSLFNCMHAFVLLFLSKITCIIP